MHVPQTATRLLRADRPTPPETASRGPGCSARPSAYEAVAAAGWRGARAAGSAGRACHGCLCGQPRGTMWRCRWAREPPAHKCMQE
eukprot:365751-Chlamydomonas_euryale.AAC.2